MKCLVLDDVRVRRNNIIEGLRKKDINAIDGHTANDFLTAIQEENLPNCIVLDVPSWNKNKSIFRYLHTTKKLANIPILFYNAEEGFTVLGDRARNERDKILFHPTPIEMVIDTVQQNL